MKSRTTLILLVLVLLLGSYIWMVDRKLEHTEQKRESARRALRLDPGAVTRLHIVSESLDVQCERVDREWRLTAPVSARGDAAAIQGILETLRQLSRAEVITAAERRSRGLKRADYGLDVPRARIAITEGSRTFQLLIGRDAPLGGRLYMQIEGSREYVATETNLLAMLPESATELRDRRLFTGAAGDVVRLDVKRADGFIQLARVRENEWRVQKPVQTRADLAAVQSLLDRLWSLRVTEFVADTAAALSLYGLDDPSAQATVLFASGGRELTLQLGNPVSGRTNELYARLQGEDAVVAVHRSILETLRTGLEDIRDRRLFTLGAHEIASVQIERGGMRLSFVSTNSLQWQMVSPRMAPADPARVQLLVSEWVGARCVRFQDDIQTNTDEWGFSPPAMTVTLARQPPGSAPDLRSPDPASDVVTVTVGRVTSGGLAPVRLGREKGIGFIPVGTLDVAGLPPLSFRDRTVAQLDESNVIGIQRAAGADVQAIERSGTNDFRAVGQAADVDRGAVREILKTMGRLRALSLVAEDVQDLSAYGLQAPAATVTFQLAGTTALAKSLLLGTDAPDGSVYAMIKGQDVVFTIEKGVRDILARSLYKIPDVDAGIPPPDSTAR